MNNVKLYISRLCIPNLVFDFCALPQIMFFFLYVGFYLQFQLWTSLMIKGHSCCGSHSKGRSLLLSNLQFVGWLYFGSSSFLGPSVFLGLSLFFWWSSFLGTWLFLVLSPMFGFSSFFWVVFLFGIVFKYWLVIILSKTILII